MDEYLSEKEQIEQIKRWWSENGWFLVGGAVLAGLGFFGWNQYEAYQNRVAEEAGALYQQLSQAVVDDDRALADSLLTRLATDYSSSGYTDQARMLIASDNLIRDTDRAIRELETVVNGSGDAGLAHIARLRLARVLAYDEQYDRALATLEVEETGAFEGLYSDVRGDVHAANGDTQAAIAAYTEALFAAAGGTVDTEYVQLKLNDLIQLSAPASAVSVDDSAESGGE